MTTEARRLTLQELKTREERARQGIEHYWAVDEMYRARMRRLEQEQPDAHRDRRQCSSFVQFCEAVKRELEAAAALIREGLPDTGLELGKCLETLGILEDEAGSHQRVVPILSEALSLLKSRPALDDLYWARAMINATTYLGIRLRLFGRLAEAAAVMEEGEQARCASSRRQELTDHPFPLMWLPGVYVELGRYERAIEVGREAERAVLAAKGGKPASTWRGWLLIVWAAMASAYEGLGRTEECWDYTERVNHMGLAPPDAFPGFARTARMLYLAGWVEEAETVLDNALGTYTRGISGDIHGASFFAPGVRALLPALREMLALKREMGRETDETRAVELDVEENEAILDSLKTAALDELRAELREEEEGGAGGTAATARAGAGAGEGGGGGGNSDSGSGGSGVVAGAGAGAGAGGDSGNSGSGSGGSGVGAGAGKKKKPTRKQQKRKAAQRRRRAEAEAQQAAAAAAAAAAEAAATGGAGDEEESLTAAVAAQLSIDEEQAEAEAAQLSIEPEPEPEADEPDEPDEPECSICLCDLGSPSTSTSTSTSTGNHSGEGDGVARLVCQHAFHAGCLERWKAKCLEKGLPFTCCMCRRLVVVVVVA